MIRIARNKRGQAWRKQEKSLVQDDGAKPVPGSGCGTAKGDAKGRTFLVQAKTTQKRSFSIKLDEAKKYEKEAKMEDRSMVMQIQLVDQHKYALLRWDDFTELLLAAGVPL